ncbi:hypothetical protein SAMN05421858_0943 [Haladaptatus litoreus]|uniref:CHAT domain-containing protein n=2 Tax=Haladaptatus litoreus TaxID=553468 RepID=A0A1N6X0X1_9EURY|nr:hypothetical protein SAMN05421858_0943 [Haladaptatus litoreus]
MTDVSFSTDMSNSPRPEFETISDPFGVLVYDPIEQIRFELHTSSSPTLRPKSVDNYQFPVTSAVTFSTDRIVVPKLLGVYGRNQNFEIVFSWSGETERSASSRGASYLEFDVLPIKLYLAVNSPVTISATGSNTVIELGSESVVTLGARSLHERPAGTITVPDDVDATMRAVSLLGSALKTTSPERSFPTLRGHPPTIERGEKFSVSDGIERPDTGVELVIPPTREYVYPATSLAYYLGAKVVPGTSPRLVANGAEYELDGPAGYETEVGRALQHLFFLDCLTRTEGLYQMPLHERQQVESRIDLDYAALYEMPLAERLAAYFSVPFELLETSSPKWHLTTDVTPTPENVEVLPFIADDLSLVRCPTEPKKNPTRAPPTKIGDFCRGTESESESEPRAMPPDRLTVEPEPTDSVEHAWVGEGCPLGSNKVTLTSLQRRIERTAPDRSNIRIRVVCNDEAMRAEGIVKEMYGFRKLVDYDVEIAYDLTTTELRDLLASPIDFLHYIGHVDYDGIQCADGILDCRDIENVQVRTFLLNACRSYEQGTELIEKGSHAGVVTLSDVSNPTATKVGRTLARHLNVGFPFRVALSIARKQTLSGYEYITIGDGGMSLCQPQSGACYYGHVSRTDEEKYLLELRLYVNQQFSIGMYNDVLLDVTENVYLGSGTLDTFELTAEELDGFFELESMPFEYDGDLYWSDDITAADLC